MIMAIQKNGILGSVKGKVGVISCYSRFGVNIAQSANVNTGRIVAPLNEGLKSNYDYFVSKYKEAHSVYYQFLNFPQPLAVDSERLPLTKYFMKGLGLKSQVVKVPTVSSFVGNVKASVLVNQSSLPSQIRFNIYCDRGQFLPDEEVLVCQTCVSLKGLSFFNDFRVYTTDSRRFFNIYNAENPEDVFYCDVFVYGRTSGRVSNFTSFLAKLLV